jgi:hypothetical protein
MLLVSCDCYSFILLHFLRTYVRVFEDKDLGFLRPHNLVSTSIIRRKLLYISCDFLFDKRPPSRILKRKSQQE